MAIRAYMETSFFGYLTSRPSLQVILLARQQAARVLW